MTFVVEYLCGFVMAGFIDLFKDVVYRGFLLKLFSPFIASSQQSRLITYISSFQPRWLKFEEVTTRNAFFMNGLLKILLELAFITVLNGKR